MSKQRVIDYVMNTPGNTNPNVLDTILDEEMNNRFIVKLTPTSETGGTMDKSNVEILEAYMQGKQIMFDITVGSAACRVQATIAASFDGVQYPSFNAYGVDSEHHLIHLYVDPSNSESDTFTMQIEDLGGGASNLTVKVTGSESNVQADASYETMLDVYENGGIVLFNYHTINMIASKVTEIGKDAFTASIVLFEHNGGDYLITNITIKLYEDGTGIIYRESKSL